MEKSSRGQIGYVSAIRGFAAMNICFIHFLSAFYPAVYSGVVEQIHTARHWELIIRQSPLMLLIGGNIKIPLLFVLSGFVLSRKSFSRLICRS